MCGTFCQNYYVLNKKKVEKEPLGAVGQSCFSRGRCGPRWRGEIIVWAVGP